jgi:WD40 repeat protein
VRRVWKISDGSLVSETKVSDASSDRFGVLYLKKNKDKVYEVWSGPPGVPGESKREDDPVQPQPLVTFKGGSEGWFGAVTLDGKTAASEGVDRTVYIWDIERWDKVTGEGRTVLSAQPDEVWRLGFTPDGKALAIACKDGSVRLWDLATRKERLKFDGTAGYVRSLVFSPDGTVLAGGNWQKNLYVWNVATGKLLWSKTDVTGPVHAVAFSPDGKTLASAGLVRDPDDKEQRSSINQARSSCGTLRPERSNKR